MAPWNSASRQVRIAAFATRSGERRCQRGSSAQRARRRRRRFDSRALASERPCARASRAIIGARVIDRRSVLENDARSRRRSTRSELAEAPPARLARSLGGADERIIDRCAASFERVRGRGDRDDDALERADRARIGEAAAVALAPALLRAAAVVEATGERRVARGRRDRRSRDRVLRAFGARRCREAQREDERGESEAPPRERSLVRAFERASVPKREAHRERSVRGRFFNARTSCARARDRPQAAAFFTSVASPTLGRRRVNAASFRATPGMRTFRARRATTRRRREHARLAT